jgi:hypothetical protein
MLVNSLKMSDRDSQGWIAREDTVCASASFITVARCPQVMSGDGRFRYRRVACRRQCAFSVRGRYTSQVGAQMRPQMPQ